MQTTTINNSPHIIIRIIWFVFIGLTLSGIWTAIAWLLCISIIGLPIGLIMLDKLPYVSTLRGEQLTSTTNQHGSTTLNSMSQYPFVVRAFYFLLIGWWLSAIWLGIAWFLSSSIIGIPAGFWMINRVPAVLTLDRN
ncbi:MAG: hypothetical protein RL076_1246 [Chloroflexota bacterium]|jgi:uncharacterized membrane protein YccF (DUF307 family)